MTHRRRLLRAGIVAACAVLMAGCAAVEPYEGLAEDRLDGRDVSMVYVPAPDHVYVEVTKGARRYPDVELPIGAHLLASLSFESLDYALGFSDPTSAAILVGEYLIEGAIEARRQGVARQRAEPFNGRIASWAQGQGQLVDAVERVLPAAAGIERLTVHVLKPDDDEDHLLESLPDDHLLVVTSTAAFTPRFEVLEVSLVYGLFDRRVSEDEPVLGNKVIVQSRVHAGARGDTRDEIQRLARQWLDETLTEIDAHPKLGHAQRIVARNEAIKRSRTYVRDRMRRYSTFDDCDPDGALWLDDGGSPFRLALADGYREAVRLMAADLSGVVPQGTDTARPPGYARELKRLAALDRGSRKVYQLEDGAFVSVDERSRLIVFSSNE